MPFSVIQFPLYFAAKRALGDSPDEPLAPSRAALCGAVCSATAAVLTTPFDVAQTRIMLRPPDGPTLSTLGALREIHSSRGVGGLFAGGPGSEPGARPSTVGSRASDGTDLGVLDCGFHFGSQGKGTPFGVRTLEGGGWDLLFGAAMDNPQDSRNQRILVVDASGLDASGAAKSTCDVVQEIGIPTSYSGPHLLGIDTATGELYAARVADAPKSVRRAPQRPPRFACPGVPRALCPS